MRNLYFKDGEIVELEQEQLYLVDDTYTQLTTSEVDKHLNLTKYWTAEQLAEHNRLLMPNLSPKDFDLKLIQHDLYDSVQAIVQSNIELKIAYTRATFFSRTDPFVEQARKALGLTDAQVDEMWMA